MIAPERGDTGLCRGRAFRTVVLVLLLVLLLSLCALPGSAAAQTTEINNFDRVFHGDDRILVEGPDLEGALGDYETVDGVSLSPLNPVPWDLNDGEDGRFWFEGQDHADTSVLLRTPTPDRLRVFDEWGNLIHLGDVVERQTITMVAEHRPGFFEAGHRFDFKAFEDDIEVTGAFEDHAITNIEITPSEFKATIDLTEITKGTYDIGVQPSDTIFYDAAYVDQFDVLRTVEVVPEEEANLELETQDTVRGERVTFEISSARRGEVFGVFIDSGGFQNWSKFVPNARVFRLVGDTRERGLFDDAEVSGAFAIIQRDDHAIGQISTSYLDATNVDVELYELVDAEGKPVDLHDASDMLRQEILANNDIDTITMSVEAEEHPSGVSQELWDAVTGGEDLRFQHLIDAVMAFQDTGEIDGVPVSFQDLIDLVQWFTEGSG